MKYQKRGSGKYNMSSTDPTGTHVQKYIYNDPITRPQKNSICRSPRPALVESALLKQKEWPDPLAVQSVHLLSCTTDLKDVK